MEENLNTKTNSGFKHKGLVIALVALLVVILVGIFAYGQLRESASQTLGAEQAAARAELGEDAMLLIDNDAIVYSSTGQPFSLTELADGKPLVINLWATWCPYCLKEMGDYQSIYNDYSDRVSFAFVDYVDGQRETVEDGSAWLQENGYDLPDYYDTKREVAMTFGVNTLPTTIVVSAEGEILTIASGQIDPASMRSSLDSLLS